jgi:hypothetical protein
LQAGAEPAAREKDCPREGGPWNPVFRPKIRQRKDNAKMAELLLFPAKVKPL